jgi:uncharacterized membrane protein YkoI
MRQILTILLILGGCCLASQATANPAAPVPAGLTVAQSDGMSLNEAVEQVRRQYNGRIVSAETKRSGNREVHHIKVLTEDGKVKTVKIPGRTLRNQG